MTSKTKLFGTDATATDLILRAVEHVGRTGEPYRFAAGNSKGTLLLEINVLAAEAEGVECDNPNCPVHGTSKQLDLPFGPVDPKDVN